MLQIITICKFITHHSLIPFNFLEPSQRASSYMEGNGEVPHGWPFGLGNMNSRITAADATQPMAAAGVGPVAPPQPYPSRNLRSSSFSSFSSSNLDTESTESFFPDRSVSLGRLIGIKPMNKGKLVQQQHHHHHHHRFSDERSRSGVPKGQQNSQGICAPLLHHVIGLLGKIGSNK